jgi:hypothetical protein
MKMAPMARVEWVWALVQQPPARSKISSSMWATAFSSKAIPPN